MKNYNDDMKILDLLKQNLIYSKNLLILEFKNWIIKSDYINNIFENCKEKFFI